MQTITVYTPAELKDHNPDGFEKALDWFRYTYNDEIHWSDEIMDSLKACFKASGIRLTDWSIGADSYSYVRFDMDSDVRELSGNRALAWLENNLLGDLRVEFHPYTFVLPSGTIHKTKRAELAKYGQYYRPGMIKPCPFTGVCFDEDMIESLLKDIKAGETLGDAYSNLADVARRLFESEIEYQNSEENFLEQEHLQFTEDGRKV